MAYFVYATIIHIQTYIAKYVTYKIRMSDTQQTNKNSFMGKLLTNNSGVSAKSFFLIAVTVVGTVMLAVIAFCMIWEVTRTNQVNADLSGYANIIAAVSALFGAAGLTKVVGEFNERRAYQSNGPKYTTTKTTTHVETVDETSNVLGTQNVDCPD